jgi:hypothetical protein
MLSIKSGDNGVDLNGMKPETLAGFVVVVFYFIMEIKQPCRLTSGTEGPHGHNSLHFAGLAFDIGKAGVREVFQPKVRADLAARLGDQFDVVDEGNHWHIEYQPERRKP